MSIELRGVLGEAQFHNVNPPSAIHYNISGSLEAL